MSTVFSGAAKCDTNQKSKRAFRPRAPCKHRGLIFYKSLTILFYYIKVRQCSFIIFWRYAVANIVVIIDWSNIDRGSRDLNYKVGEYHKEAGFQGIKNWLSEIGNVIWTLIYTPFHDVYGHFEFLRDQGFTIVVCPVKSVSLEDTTDPKIISDILKLINSFNMDYFFLGSGDGGFKDVLQAAKNKGIKVGIIYGSDNSLSRELGAMADSYPKDHPKAGEPMLHLFSPRSEMFISSE